VERVELFDRFGNRQWFEVPNEAYQHVLHDLDSYYGGSVETHDSTTRAVAVEDIVQTNDSARLNVDFIVRSIRGESVEEAATWAAIDPAVVQTVSHSVDALIVSARKRWNPPARVLGQLFLDEYLARGDRAR
jgi:hypothetical protein